MDSRFSDHECLEAGVVHLYYRFATTTSGAVGAVTRKRGLGTPTRDSTGTYSIPLADPTMAVLDVSINVEGASVGTSKGFHGRPKSETLSGASPKVVIEFLNKDEAVADVADGNVIFGCITVKTGSV